jgi:cysteine dioxygenase
MAVVCLENVVRLLREEVQGRPSGRVDMGERLGGVHIDPASLRPYLHFARGRYTRNLVYRDARMEVILNCWDADVASPIHDHDGQECWFSIQSGRFLLENYPLLSGGHEPGPARLGGSQVVGPVGPGHVDFRDLEAPIHRVVSHGMPGITLHVYAGPVERCLVYDPHRHRCALHEMRYHSIFGRPVRAGDSVASPSPPLFR